MFRIRIWMKACILAVTFSFILPYITWAFEPAGYWLSQGRPRVAHLGKPLEIPQNLGTIIDSFQGKGKTVICIQDLHCNYEVQKKIAALIGLFVKQHGLKLVGEEGAWLPVDVSVARDFPVASIREAVTDYFVRQGKVSGAEYYAATAAQPLRLEGIENQKDYANSLKNVLAFLNSESQGYLCDLRKKLDELKPQLYNEPLKTLDRQRMAYRDGKLEILRYGADLESLARRMGLDLRTYPELERYLSLKQEFFNEGIDSDALLGEMDRLESALRAGLYNREEQRELDEYSLRLDVMEKLLNISATHSELAEFRNQRECYRVNAFLEFLQAHHPDQNELQDPGVVRLDQCLDQAGEFYRLADVRSAAFVNNLLAKMEAGRESLAVMVNGGFHSPEVQARLKARGVSFIAVKPRLGRQDVLNPYFELLRNRKSSLERLLEKNQTVLAVEASLGKRGFDQEVSLIENVAVTAEAFPEEAMKAVGIFDRTHSNLDAAVLKLTATQANTLGLHLLNDEFKLVRAKDLVFVVGPSGYFKEFFSGHPGWQRATIEIKGSEYSRSLAFLDLSKENPDSIINEVNRAVAGEGAASTWKDYLKPLRELRVTYSISLLELSHFYLGSLPLLRWFLQKHESTTFEQLLARIKDAQDRTAQTLIGLKAGIKWTIPVLILLFLGLPIATVMNPQAIIFWLGVLSVFLTIFIGGAIENLRAHVAGNRKHRLAQSDSMPGNGQSSGGAKYQRRQIREGLFKIARIPKGKGSESAAAGAAAELVEIWSNSRRLPEMDVKEMLSSFLDMIETNELWPGVQVRLAETMVQTLLAHGDLRPYSAIVLRWLAFHQPEAARVIVGLLAGVLSQGEDEVRYFAAGILAQVLQPRTSLPEEISRSASEVLANQLFTQSSFEPGRMEFTVNGDARSAVSSYALGWLYSRVPRFIPQDLNKPFPVKSGITEADIADLSWEKIVGALPQAKTDPARIRVLGRTAIIPTGEGDYTLKMAKDRETPADMAQEENIIEWQPGQFKNVELARPAPLGSKKIGRIKWMDLPENVRAAMISACSDGGYQLGINQKGKIHFIAYWVKRIKGFDFFRYLNDPRVTKKVYQRASEAAMNYLGVLARHGIVHVALADLMHDRGDGRRFLWMIEWLRDSANQGMMGSVQTAGVLLAAEAAVAHPNLRAYPSLPDAAELHTLKEAVSFIKDGTLATNDLRIALVSYLGDYLEVGMRTYIKWLKYRRDGWNLDKKTWQDPKKLKEMQMQLQKSFMDLYKGFAGGEPSAESKQVLEKINWQRLVRQIAFFQGGAYREYLAKKEAFPEGLYSQNTQIIYENQIENSDGWGYIHLALVRKIVDEELKIKEKADEILKHIEKQYLDPIPTLGTGSFRRRVRQNYDLNKILNDPSIPEEIKNPLFEMLTEFQVGWRNDGMQEDSGPPNGPNPLAEFRAALFLYTTGMVVDYSWNNPAPPTGKDVAKLKGGISGPMRLWLWGPIAGMLAFIAMHYMAGYFAFALQKRRNAHGFGGAPALLGLMLPLSYIIHRFAGKKTSGKYRPVKNGRHWAARLNTAKQTLAPQNPAVQAIAVEPKPFGERISNRYRVIRDLPPIVAILVRQFLLGVISLVLGFASLVQPSLGWSPEPIGGSRAEFAFSHYCLPQDPPQGAHLMRLGRMLSEVSVPGYIKAKFQEPAPGQEKGPAWLANYYVGMKIEQMRAVPELAIRLRHWLPGDLGLPLMVLARRIFPQAYLGRVLAQMPAKLRGGELMAYLNLENPAGPGGKYYLQLACNQAQADKALLGLHKVALAWLKTYYREQDFSPAFEKEWEAYNWLFYTLGVKKRVRMQELKNNALIENGKKSRTHRRRQSGLRSV